VGVTWGAAWRQVVWPALGAAWAEIILDDDGGAHGVGLF
jgi:hypothetical protein